MEALVPISLLEEKVTTKYSEAMVTTIYTVIKQLQTPTILQMNLQMTIWSSLETIKCTEEQVWTLCMLLSVMTL